MHECSSAPAVSYVTHISYSQKAYLRLLWVSIRTFGPRELGLCVWPKSYRTRTFGLPVWHISQYRKTETPESQMNWVLCGWKSGPCLLGSDSIMWGVLGHCIAVAMSLVSMNWGLLLLAWGSCTFASPAVHLGMFPISSVEVILHKLPHKTVDSSCKPRNDKHDI